MKPTPHLRPLLPVDAPTGLPIAALLLAIILAIAVAGAACAPSAGTGAAADAGRIAPPFAMQLADGAPVSLKNLVDDQQPAFIMYFATW